MTWLGWVGALELAELGRLPDVLVRGGIRMLVRRGLRDRAAVNGGQESRLRDALVTGPIAVRQQTANDQHYELPAAFFGLVLGRRRKYSGCFWPTGVTTLDAAEEASLRETCAHAQLADGMEILELGCGWGSLTLWMAEHYPRARITAVSNSRSQREFIEQRCREAGFSNVHVLTADVNDLRLDGAYDRVVSVEMFEHVRNHALLMRRIAGWLRLDGKLFVHIFVHGRTTYLFESRGPGDWMTEHFFAGGIMPHDGWLPHFQDDLRLEAQWRQDGRHYQRTADAWLRNLDANRTAALRILAGHYGVERSQRWLQRWRMFFMACAEMFGYDQGREWWVSHYLFARR